jgi:hypothetical protein
MLRKYRFFATSALTAGKQPLSCKGQAGLCVSGKGRFETCSLRIKQSASLMAKRKTYARAVFFSSLIHGDRSENHLADASCYAK